MTCQRVTLAAFIGSHNDAIGDLGADNTSIYPFHMGWARPLLDSIFMSRPICVWLKE